MVTQDSLEWACQRIEDFYAVQKGGGMDQMLAALNVLRESVGLDDDMFTYFNQWVEEFCGDEHQGALLLGLLVGLLTNDHNRW